MPCCFSVGLVIQLQIAGLQGGLQLDTCPYLLYSDRLAVGNVDLQLAELHASDHPDEFFFPFCEPDRLASFFIFIAWTCHNSGPLRQECPENQWALY